MYRLSPDRGPRWLALRRVKSADPDSGISVKEGLKLLDDKVSNALLEILSLQWDPDEKKVRPYLKREEIKGLEIDEVLLPQALARYDFEVNTVRGMVRAVREGYPLDDPEEPIDRLFMQSFHRPSSDPAELFVKFCNSELGNPNVYPSRKVAEDWNVTEQLNGLLKWISPLIESPSFETDKGLDVGKWLWDSICPSNYVAFIFRSEKSKYIRECITPSWEHALKK